MESSSGYSEKKGKVRKKNKKIKSSEVFYEIIQFYLIVLFLYSNSRDFALLFDFEESVSARASSMRDLSLSTVSIGQERSHNSRRKTTRFGP